MIPKGYEKAVMHHNKALATAEHALHEYLNGKPFKATDSGSNGLIRQGKKRQVQYLELTDESNVTLRIEVYVV